MRPTYPGGGIMSDVFYIILSVLFFAVAAALMRGCARLS